MIAALVAELLTVAAWLAAGVLLALCACRWIDEWTTTGDRKQ